MAGRRLAGTAAGVEAEFIDADGTRRREPLSSCWNVPFERVSPVRGFASFRGQRNRPGLWWFATTGQEALGLVDEAGGQGDGAQLRRR